MAARAFGRALVASGGTLLVLGGSTLAVTTIAMGLTKQVVDRQRRSCMAPCQVCVGEKKTPCAVCDGERRIRYSPPEAPVPLPGSKMASIQCCCVLCEGTGMQICSNCLGEGEIYDSSLTLKKIK